MGEALIRTRVLGGWNEFLSEYGLDLTELMSKLIARKRTTSTGHDAVSLSEFVDFLEKVSNKSSRPGLSWNAGSKSDYGTRGAIGRAVLSSKTLGTGLRRLATYFPLLQDATELSLDVKEDWTTLSYKILDPQIWPRHNDALYSLGVYSNLIRRAAPDVWDYTEVTLEASADHFASNISSIVHAKCSFEGDTNSLSFPTSALNSILHVVEPIKHEIEELNRRLVRQKRQSLIIDRLEYAIFRNLRFGSVLQDDVARELGMTGRTLRRRLVKENTTYQKVLDSCRMRAAVLEFLIRKTASISEIALQLGYSEHSTFTRAFSRWMGMPPQYFRCSKEVSNQALDIERSRRIASEFSNYA